MPINQDQFWGSDTKVCATYPIKANVAIIISDFQQKYVVLKVMRRSGGISKIVLIEKLKSKVYVSFRISLYVTCSLVLATLTQERLRHQIVNLQCSIGFCGLVKKSLLLFDLLIF